ncbi:MAG: hypothetical protein JO303_11540, partial [Caulobacteraceae bacterium]|nr:hypothetical protein [Caulobacteraceae bacterium]
GIECDGASYRAGRSARDRDRIRRAVLEDHGWTIHRLWSADWFQRPNEELERIVSAIEAAKSELGSVIDEAIDSAIASQDVVRENDLLVQGPAAARPAALEPYDYLRAPWLQPHCNQVGVNPGGLRKGRV